DMAMDPYPGFSSDNRIFSFIVRQCTLEEQTIFVVYNINNLNWGNTIAANLDVLETFLRGQDLPDNQEARDTFFANLTSAEFPSDQLVGFIAANRELSFSYLQLAEIYPEGSTAREKQLERANFFQATTYGAAVFGLEQTQILPEGHFQDITYDATGYVKVSGLVAITLPLYFEGNENLSDVDILRLKTINSIFANAALTGNLKNLETDSIRDMEIILAGEFPERPEG
ncbi:MAG: hypothetical protein V3R64_08665, partial [Sphingomonadales bacterium]